MDIRICALLLLLAVVGSYGEFHAFGRQPRDVEGLVESKVEYYEPAGIVKRAVDDKNATKSDKDSKDVSTTTPKSTTTTTVAPTSSKTTPKPTDATTKPSTEGTTKSTSDKPQVGTRSAFENKDETPSKPSNDEKKAKQPDNGKEPPVSSRMNPDSGSNPSAPNLDSTYQPYGNNPFPGYNSIPPYGPNYAQTFTNHGPGGSVSSSAASFASSGGSPNYPSFGSRNSFYDNTPSYYNPNGYGSGNVWSTNPKKPTNDVPQDKPLLNSRSNFDNNDKPVNNVGPVQNPNSLPFSGPQNFPTHGFGGPYSPNFDYPAVNSVQGPNYAWTNSGPGYSQAAAGASIGSSGTPTFSSRGAFSDNNAGAGFPDNSAYAPGNVGTFSFPQPSFGPSFEDSFAIHQRMMDEHFRRIQDQIEAHQRAIQEANQLGSNGGFSSPGVHSAVASINLGPRGGFQTGQISPVAPGVESRFAEELPASSGGQYGVFAQAKSTSMTDSSGKTIAHKSATTGVNDNGKITFRTVED